MACPTPPRDLLIDVSRLVWRYWTRRLPTGIDRVCLAYLEHFGPGAHAVLQRSGQHFILPPGHSDRLFRLLKADRPPSRLRLATVLAEAAPWVRRAVDRPGLIYLNVGHTGLNEPTLPGWIARNKLRAIYMIHDLIPITHPQYCRPAERVRHIRRMDNVLASAAGVIGNSQTTLDDLEAFARKRGALLPPSVAAWISGPPPQPAVGAAPLDEPYFVILGTIEGRKNHQLILDVWAQLVAECGRDAPVLVVIGQRGWQAAGAIAQLDHKGNFADRVRQFNRCGDDDLANWLGGAQALLMPSFAEGFGLPVVEALQSGTPVIASDLAVFREIAGDIPTFLSPLDRAGWKAAILSFANDGRERRRQLGAMRSYSPSTWPGHFQIVDDWLATVSPPLASTAGL